ncbi:MAG: aspartate kinase [Myxococcota bacterium]
MRIVVQKYGGSSVADLDRIRAVARRIAQSADGARVCVVVSAMGNTTNELLALARQVAERPDRRELDMLISVGERVTMALLAMCLRDLGVRARSLTGSQSGIVTDEAHADARVVEVRPDRLRQVLDGGEVAIVAGFQGVSRLREVTTLGRGGSDTTAVVLAAALGAAHAEICSDVDGVWSADPRVVPEAVKLDALSLEEALALARGGAKVLFEDAVRYARDHGVEIVASSTFGPGSGTRLVAGTVPSASAASAVTGDADLLAVPCAPTDVETLQQLAAAGARVRRRVGDTLHVDVRNAHGGLAGHAPIAVVTAVGSALGERPLDLARAAAALEGAGISALAHGAQGDQAWWQVPPERLAEAVGTVHDCLVHESSAQ